jgi:hypothetical protein
MRRAALSLIALISMPTLALAQRVSAKPYPVAGQTPTEIGEVLMVILVLSVVFEVALTPLFNWRFFLARFEGKGLKTPITVAFALFVLWGYDVDIIKDLLIAMDYPAELTFWGQLLTALLVAGGSDGVLRIFTKLQIRDAGARKRKTEEAQAALAKANEKKANSSPSK